ncbi:MAG: AMP-binding protein [Acidimicrobiia bacterium]|nr:AMP-binding protein [Acidimicrobiia bacterium]
MRRVVGIALPPNQAFVDAVRRIWDAEDAVFPIDMRLPDAELRKVVESVRPTHVFDGSDTVPVERGVPADEGDAVVIATSGTTGHAKGVVLTREAIEHMVRVTNAAIGVDPATDRWLVCIPVAHMGGFSVVARSILSDTPVEMLPAFDARLVEEAARRGATLTALVPAAMRRIDAGLFRKILLGGSAIPPTRPSNTVATYGLTESCGGIVYEGRPLEGVEMRVVDHHVQLKSPTLLREYRSGTDPKVDGWLPTGDVGSITDGVLTVEGRIDEMINTGGEKVWPSRVEEALAMHPKIFDVAVTGRPDVEWTEAVTAVVVPLDPSAVPTLDELRQCVKGVLPSYMAPKRVEYVDEIPRSGLGKVRRRAL